MAVAAISAIMDWRRGAKSSAFIGSPLIVNGRSRSSSDSTLVKRALRVRWPLRLRNQFYAFLRCEVRIDGFVGLHPTLREPSARTTWNGSAERRSKRKGVADFDVWRGENQSVMNY